MASTKRTKKTLSLILTPLSFLLAWWVILMAGLVWILQVGNGSNVAGVYYQHTQELFLFYLIMSALMILCGVWFAERFYKG